jgi:hypothetical protein
VRGLTNGLSTCLQSPNPDRVTDKLTRRNTFAPIEALHFLAGGNGGTMPMFTIVSYMPRPPPEWRKVNIFARMRPLRLTEVEQDEERCLGAMLHWRDPVERLKTLRRRSHTLVDDNPASG